MGVSSPWSECGCVTCVPRDARRHADGLATRARRMQMLERKTPARGPAFSHLRGVARRALLRA
ncbi:hypothetical protein MYA_2232 [Burkholderia sp. KJ006]|nr:hypothetical protein MYA_2232 [Burkholderia sp. KJ006]